MSFKFHPNRSGIERLTKGREMRGFVTDKAKDVLAAAERLAPVASGDYKASLGSTTADVDGDGVSATVYSTDPAALILEYGSVHNPPFRTLSSAVTAAGLKFEG